MISRSSTSLLGLLILALVVVLASASSEFPTEDGVLVLDDSNIDAAIAAHPFLVVEFYAPWCGHCKKLAPEWSKAAQQLVSEGSAITLAKLDADAHKEAGGRFGVQGFPTIKIFRDGSATPLDYKGPRAADGIVSYLKRQSEPALTIASSAADVENFISAHRANKALVIRGNAAMRAVAETVANALREQFSVAFVSDDAANSVKLYRSFDEPEVTMNADEADITFAQAVQDFAKSHVLPLVGELSGTTAETYVNRGLPLGVLFLDFTAPQSERDAAIAALTDAAKANQGKMLFCYLDNAKFGQHQKRLGLAGNTPAFAIDDLHNDQRYPFASSDLSAASVSEFVRSFVAGEMAPHMRTEEPVAAAEQKSVWTLVGKEFDKDVFASNRDVFVEFYAPWCGHCKSLAPIWDELGDKFASVSDKIRIAKMDATANDPPKPIKIQGFPTLMFFKAGSKEPVPYQGDRTLQALTDFVLSSNSHGITEAQLSTSSSSNASTTESAAKDEL